MRSLFGHLHTSSSLSPLSGLPPGRVTWGRGGLWWCVCVLAGGLQAASLAWPWVWAPPGLSAGQPSGWLQILSLSVLVMALRQVHRVGQGVWRAWVFATAWLSGSFWWLYVSMHTYGGLPGWLAALAVLALAGFLALYYALAAGLLCTWAPRHRVGQALLFAALWTLGELMRGTWLTGFPWGAGGYAQVELLAGWAPWVGVYGMGAGGALAAYALGVLVPAALGRLLTAFQPSAPRSVLRAGPLRVHPTPWARGLEHGGLVLMVLVVWAGHWTNAAWQRAGQRHTAPSGSLTVWLLQGNIAQDQKFVAGTGMAQALSWYPAQIEAALRTAREGGAAPQLVVAPETAVPLLPQQLGLDFWQPLLHGLAAQADRSVASQQAEPVGVLLGLPLGGFDVGYTNSAWGLSPETATRARVQLADTGADSTGSGAQLQHRTAHPDAGFYRYDKHHLVPFGEFIPPMFRWFTELMNIPLGDFTRGDLGQAPWAWAGQRLAPNICYEDLFGEELAASFRDPVNAPTVLVNLSNIGWFGDTVAIDQHLHISRMRAMELGRPMLRATNTGATAAIDHTGRVTHQLPRLTRNRLAASVEGRSGLTPYASWAARWGLWPVWAACIAVVAAVLAARGARRLRGARP